MKSPLLEQHYHGLIYQYYTLAGEARQDFDDCGRLIKEVVAQVGPETPSEELERLHVLTKIYETSAKTLAVILSICDKELAGLAEKLEEINGSAH